MSKAFKSTLTAIGIVLLFLVVYLFIYKGQVSAPTAQDPPPEPTTSAPPDFTGNEIVLENALNLYIQKKQEGVDMTNGPCLGKVADDWVLDIAHKPRQPVDEKVENQCADFREGRAKHFIELDPDGKLIQAY